MLHTLRFSARQARMWIPCPKDAGRRRQHSHVAAANLPARPAFARRASASAPVAEFLRHSYTATMNRKSVACLFALLLAAVGGLGGCGPKDIGAGSSSESDSQPQGVSVEDQLRYPVYGSNNTQRMLYYQNRPDVMANMQQWRMQQFRRMNGLDTDVSPEDPQYRSVPKQRSPFRQ